jgi:hypothetical protein
VPDDAWVELPDRDAIYPFVAGGPYDFGFAAAMARLIIAHPRIAPAFGALFGEIMFSEDAFLTRAEREMVAGVAAAAQDCFY